MIDNDFSKESAFRFESDKCYYQPNPFIGESVLYMKEFDLSKFFSRNGSYINFSKGASLLALRNHWALDYLPWAEIPKAVYDQVVALSQELSTTIQGLFADAATLSLSNQDVENNKYYLIKESDKMCLFLVHNPKSERSSYVEGIVLDDKGLTVHRKQIVAANKDIINENSAIIDESILSQCYNEYDGFVRETKNILRNAGIQVTDTTKPQSAEMKAFRARYNVLKYYIERL